MLAKIPFDDVFRLTPLPTLLLSVRNLELKITEANSAYLKLISATESSLIGANFFSFIEHTIFSNYENELKKAINDVLETKEANSITLKNDPFLSVNHLHLTLKSIEVQHIPIVSESGELELIMQIVKVTEDHTGINADTEKLLSLIISNTEEAFIVLDKNLLITSFNEQFQKLYYHYFGIEVLTGKSILLYAAPDRTEHLKKLYENVFEGNIAHSTVEFEHQNEAKKIALKYIPIKDESDKVVGVFVTAKDMTTLTIFEKKLKTREKELSLIYNNLVEIVFLIGVEQNTRFKFLSINNAFTRASGLMEKDVVGKYVDEIIPEPSLTMVLAKYSEAIRTKASVSWEETSMYPTGEKTGIVSVNPIFDSEDNCIELIGSVYDITERVAAERGKQKAIDLLAKIMDSSLDMICTINSEGEFATMSAASKRILGYEPEQMIGKKFSTFLYEEDVELTNEVAARVMSGYETSNFENRYVKKDGTIVPILWSARWDDEEEIMYCTAKDVTDKIEAEKQLLASEQRFKSLVQEGADMIGILDLEGNYLYVSPTSLAILGISNEEFAGKNAFNFIHPDDVETVASTFEKVGIEKRVELSPFRFRHKNGTWRWIETVATDLSDEPAIQGIVTNSRDVTEKINAQKAILLSNERHKYVTKATSDAIWDWDLVSEELYWGDGFQFLFGYKPDDLAKDISSWSDKIHPTDRNRIIKDIYQIINGTGTNWVDEYRYLKADGSYAFVLDKGFVIRDEEGKAVRMVGAMQDISRRKNEEQQLKLLESVIINTSDSVVITEAKGIGITEPRILYVNKAFTKMTGYTSEEVIGKSPWILQGPKTDKAELARLKEHLQKCEACEVSMINYRKNGEEFWIDFTITPIADDQGRITHWISIERDVTERKNQEIQKILLADISQLFNETPTLTETLTKVLRTISVTGNYCAGEIWMVDEDKNELNLLTKYWNDEEMDQFYQETKSRQKFKYGEGLPGTVWESRILQVWDVEAVDFASFRNEAAHKANLSKGIGLPLFNKDELIGVLILGTRAEEKVCGSAVISDNFGQHLGAEIRRKQLEQELNQIFSFAPDMIAIANFEGYFEKINPAGCALLEYTLDELLDRPISSFLHPDDRQNINHFSAPQKSETYYFENRYLTKSGRIKWLSWASNAITEEGLIFSVAKDITDRKALEDLLLKSNSMGKIGSWEIDVIGGTVYWSPITHEIRETEPGFIPTLETGIHYFKEGRDKDTITKKVNECKAHGTPWDEELQIITFKGNLKWIRTIGQAEMVNGKCIRIFGSFQDIDERKKAELKVQQASLELAESEKRYSNLFHLSPLPMWVYDMDTLRFLDVNQTAIQHYGYSFEEFLDMTIMDIRPPEEVAKLEKVLKESQESGRLLYEGIFLHQNKKGEHLNVEIKSNVISFKGKSAKVIVANDITERIRYFNALEQQNRKLQEISWIQSHVIRAPLARLMGLIYMLKDKSAQVELSEELMIAYIEESAEELDHKIREIIEKSDQKEI